MKHVLFIILLLISSINADEFFVTSASEITTALSTVQPGDTLTMLDGEWNNQRIVFSASGTEQDSILLRAETPGRVLLTGGSNLRISGSYLIVDGLYFIDGQSPSGAIIEFRGGAHATHSRLTNTAIVNFNPASNSTDYKWISLYGSYNRVDNCYMYGKRHSGTTLVVWLDGSPNYHRIDHNYFAFRPELGINGGETIRIGTSDWSMTDSYTLVEYNYFEHCNGEIEIISNKSGHNTFRYNTFFESEGALTLRHGNYATITGNFFLGNNKALTGGIRVIGENHTIYNNYFQDLEGDGFRSALSIMNGVPDSPLNRYFQVINAHVLFNTFVNCKENIVLGAGSDSERTLPPLDCNIDNNTIITNSTRYMIDDEDDPINLNWSGNIFYGSGLGIIQPEGITLIDPMLAESEDGLWRPLEGSPLLGEAVGNFPFIITDMDGHTRGDSLDIGADQKSDEPVIIRPLTGDDVGPSWYPPPVEPQRVIYVHAGYDSLSSAVFNANNGDIIELTSDGGIYSNSTLIEINKNITIRASGNLETKPLVRNTGSASTRILFEITDGGNLQIDSLSLDGMAGSATPAKYLISTDNNPMTENYSLRVNNCDLYDVVAGSEGSFFRAYAGTFADSIIFRNCILYNSGKEGIRLKDEVTLSGLYNVAYFEMTNCTIWHTNKQAVYIKGDDEIIFTPGPRIRIDHCTFNDCGYDSASVISSPNVEDIKIFNSIFSNSYGLSPSIVLEGQTAQIAYCDTFNIAGVVTINNAFIGSGMLGLDPQYSNAAAGNFTLIQNSPLYNVANDGRALGDLRWATNPPAVGLKDMDGSLPVEFYLMQNYPNPFNPNTRIQYTIAKSGNYSLTVYNYLGQEVATLINGLVPAGTYTSSFSGSGLASGVYIYSIVGEGINHSKKMILLK